MTRRATPAVRPVTVRRVGRGARAASPSRDAVVVEEPLEIRLAGEPLAVLMRTPGDEAALAAGFLVTEGILRGPRDVGAIAFCVGAARGRDADERNVVDVTPSVGARVERPKERSFLATSSCGVCGKASLDAVFVRALPVRERARVAAETLVGLPDRLAARQVVFRATGGLHAAGLFALDGRPIDLAEDVGRHNAVDKIVGRAIVAGRFPLAKSVLLVSGRASFEIVQKALVARVPIVASVSAPSSLAVELARRSGMTLVGFLRGRSMVVYAGAERISRARTPIPARAAGSRARRRRPAASRASRRRGRGRAPRRKRPSRPSRGTRRGKRARPR